MTRVAIAAVVTAIAALLTSPAGAQTRLAADWKHGTVVSGFIGGGGATSGGGDAAGVGLGWEFSRQVALEGRGRWFDSKDSSGSFAADLVMRVSTPPLRKVIPYLSGGIGMYRADIRALDSNVPAFYRARLDVAVAGTSHQTFRDVLWTIAGGVDVFVKSHIAIRPEATVMLITTTDDLRATSVIGVHVVYHFDAHPRP